MNYLFSLLTISRKYALKFGILKKNSDPLSIYKQPAIQNTHIPSCLSVSQILKIPFGSLNHPGDTDGDFHVSVVFIPSAWSLMILTCFLGKLNFSSFNFALDMWFNYLIIFPGFCLSSLLMMSYFICLK